MRKFFLLTLIVYSNFIFSQENPLDRYLSKIENIDHNNCVKSIFVEDYKYDENKEKMDHLSKKFKVIFNDKNKIVKHITYWKDLQIPFKITTYDSQNRISKVKINREDGNGEILIQYFRSGLTEPDSIKIFSSEMIERRKYINHFKNDLVIRRDLIENDTLRHYTLFEYDSKNHLTKELNINTKNGFGVINNLGNSSTKILNPNDSTLFSYKEAGDTIIIDRERYKGLIVREKTYKDEAVEINIEEQISKNKNFTFQRRTNTKWNDSTISEHKYYKNKNELKSYYKSSTYNDKILSEWIDPFMMKDGKAKKVEIIKIETKFDNSGNWIIKKYINNGSITNEINRIIEYY